MKMLLGLGFVKGSSCGELIRLCFTIFKFLQGGILVEHKIFVVTLTCDYKPFLRYQCFYKLIKLFSNS